jgi:muconate cycloisomerase
LLSEWVASPEFGEFGAEQNRLLLRVSDRDGFEGWAETGSCPPESMLKETAGQLLGRPLAEFRPAFLDLWPPGSQYWQRPLPPSPYTPTLPNLQHRLRHPLQTLIETALTDLTAKRAGVPFHSLLGGAWRDRVLTDYWMGETTPEHAQRCVRRGMQLGFHGIKLKTTLEDPNVERLEAIREVAPDWKVTVDPNGRFYGLDDALPTIRAMDVVGNMAILEDPFPRFHLEQFAALRSRIQARVVLHLDPLESLWAVLQSGAAGGLNIDSAEGLFKWCMQAAVAAQANLSIWHGSGLDLGIRTATQLHLAASAPNCQLPGDQIGPWIRESHLLKDDFVVENGHILVPRGPGLGVEVDFDKLEEYTIRQHSWKV